MAAGREKQSNREEPDQRISIDVTGTSLDLVFYSPVQFTFC